MYYGLTNFYQNHRRYVKSRDDRQLLGNNDTPTSDCAPFQYGDNGKPVAPCGAIANSLFSGKSVFSFNLLKILQSILLNSFPETDNNM